MQTVSTMPVQRPYTSKEIYTQNNCKDCHSSTVCFGHSLTGEDLNAFNSIVKQSKKLSRGEYLYHAGDPFKSIYVIRSGSIKTFIDDEEGREQILGFSIQGDVVALDGTTSTVYPTSAQVLETTYVCEIPFAKYMELAVQIPSLYEQLLSHMSHQIRDDEEHTMLIGTKTVEQRVATMLLNLSNRYAARGFSKTEFNLHMSRRDIGNYLSAAMETVSRLFSRLQVHGLIEVQGKLVKIVDLEGLKNYAA